MNDDDLKKYYRKAIDVGAAHIKPIHPNTVITAPWVRLKCQFGCEFHDKRWCCPPHTPTAEQTRKILDSYQRAVLFHIEAPKTPERGKRYRKFYEALVDLESDMFKDGYYKAFMFVAGPCMLCKECTLQEDKPCNFGIKARPSMEGCGIDVYATVRGHDFYIEPLHERTETQNSYCLMLVD